MLQQRVFKGFATVKFILGIYLISQVFFCLYSLYQVWPMDGQYVRKIIYSLLLIVSIAVIYAFNSLLAIKRFILGVGRYNQVHYLASSLKNSQQLNPQKEKKSAQSKTKNKFVTKYQSLPQNDLMSFFAHKKQQQEKKKHVVRSLSMSIDFSEADPDVIQKQAEDREKDLQIMKNSYMQYSKQHNLNSSAQQIKISKAKKIIGNVFKIQANKQIGNLQALSSKLQKLYDIYIVQKKRDSAYNNLQGRSYEKNLALLLQFDDNKEVLLDQIMEHFDRGTLRRSGYRFNKKAAQDSQYRTLLVMEIKTLINERKTLDKRINFNYKFTTNKTRIQAIERIKSIARHYLEDKSLLAQPNASVQFQIIQLTIWMLSGYFNEHLRANTSHFRIFLQLDSTEPDRRQYIRWLPAETLVITHYNQVINKNFEGTVINYCAPGDQNIPSLLVRYLSLFEPYQIAELNVLPQIKDFVNETKIQKK